MNFKNMKSILLVASVLALGVVCRAEAFYTTVRSTAVQISSAAAYHDGMEILSISYSTGSSILGDQFIVVADSYAYAAQTSGLGQASLRGGTTLQSVAYGRAQWPVEQYIVPPIVVFTTAPLNNPAGASPGLTKINLRDDLGCGVPVADGITVLQPGTAYGTVVTIEWRPRPTIGPCKQD